MLSALQIPMLKWWKLKGEDKLKLLDGLQLVTSWKGFDEGPQFELTGELKPHQETGENFEAVVSLWQFAVCIFLTVFETESKQNKKKG